MNAQSIINDLQLKRDDKLILMRLAKLFDENTPTALYLDYYELAEQLGATPHQWEQFLDIPEVWRYTKGKIAKLQEFAAVKAMKKLENDPSAASLKELIKTTKSLGSGQQREKIILTYVKPKVRTS